jgi:NDP-sugar pyrophosphorylase family protein
VRQAFAFSGIQILDPGIFPMITETGKFSLTDLYLRLAKTETITGYLEKGAVWRDVGR